MASAFDDYNKSYAETVERSIAFSGLKHDFFLAAKVERLRRLFASHFGDRRPALLDVGCGVGAMHGLLATIAGSISGADPSAACLERARSANPDASYVEAAGGRLPWADGSADVALAVCVFHHVAVGERAALVAEMARCVRPNGLVVIIEHNPWNPLTRLAVARCPFDHDAVLLDWRACQRLLAGGGLPRPRSEHFLVLPFTGRLAGAVEGVLERVPLGAQYMTSAVVP